MIRKLIVAAALALAASQSHALPAPQSPARIVLELDAENLRIRELRTLDREAYAKLQEAPLIRVLESGPQGDALVIRLANAADTRRAYYRLRALGDASEYLMAHHDDGVIEIRLSQPHFEKMHADALITARDVVERRVQQSEVSDAVVETTGTNRIVVQTPNLDASGFQTLIDMIGPAGVLTFNLVDMAADPSAYEVGVPRNNRVALPNDSLDGMPHVVMLDAIISGPDLSGARVDFDVFGQPSIAFQLHGSGAQKFGRATRENIGRPFAIVLDERIVSAPTIQSAITGGSGLITGAFTLDEAEQLAIVLRSGALPARLVVVERSAPQ